MLESMQQQSVSHIAVVGNALPRRCGLATYTSHSVSALRQCFPGVVVDHYAMDDGFGTKFGDDVTMAIRADSKPAYVRAAAEIERSGAKVLWLHHEYGIFGGADGEDILTLLTNVGLPVVATLHTVLARPTANQRRILRAIADRSERLIVMSRRGAELLDTVYGADPARITVIPHGAPDRPLIPTRVMKEKLGLPPRPLALTFGLLSKGKGIETVIRALPEVVRHHPELSYLVLGATHPVLVRAEGEKYRESLERLARDLGVEDNVAFVDGFLDDDVLLDHLQAADIYVTPYLDREQVTSGTLSYALAMGRPVISTPYYHAEEALSGGMGTLVPFADQHAMAAALLDHLGNPQQLEERSHRVWQAARSTIWTCNARAVMGECVRAVASRPRRLDSFKLPGRVDQVDLSGIRAMTDDVGIIQHSIYGIPDRNHGYCIDDNARALMLLCETHSGSPAERRQLLSTYAAFVHHAWNDQAGCFRNFMSYDRRWLEERGSQDSNGRALWALGRVMRRAPDPSLRMWATELFNKALGLVDGLRWPRSTAFAMLGLVAALEAEPAHDRCRWLLRKGAERLMAHFAEARRADWCWFEPVLAYDNARLPQALLEAGRALGDEAAVNAGMAALRWLIDIQSSPEGKFRPVGTESFGKPHVRPAEFDQQPLEAAATIDACLAACRVDGGRIWREAAQAAFDWFEGANDLGQPLVCGGGGLCYDGLTAEGVNLNVGAESILALQMARHSLAELKNVGAFGPQLSAVS